MRKTFLCMFGTLVAVSALFISVADILAQPAAGSNNEGRGRGNGMRTAAGANNFGGFGFGGGFGIGAVLQNDNAKKYLNLTDDQVEKLQKIASEQRNNFPRPPRATGNNGERPAPPSSEDLKKLNEEREKTQAETKKKINEILTPEQQTKFKALPFQMAGGLEARFINARTFDFLDLTGDQKDKLKKLDEENQAALRGLFTRPSAGETRLTREEIQKQREEITQKREALTKSYRENVLALLTPEQKATAEKLTKEAQELKLQPQRGQRRNRDARGERDDRGGRGERGRNRANDNYTPNSDSWRPGAGASEENKTPRRPFPRNNNNNNNNNAT
ncbi:MAG: Spy/CpxP family protein refolding chaperone [Planctomycetaceae bacterium]|jgi:Spy/CpxP family protein refolding chaperone|nr:Spy/CpxP family protein refolding chaperone [Planctomycetaceae bacterium]